MSQKKGTMSPPLGDGELQKCASEVLVPKESMKRSGLFGELILSTDLVAVLAVHFFLPRPWQLPRR